MAPWAVGNFVVVTVRKADGTVVDISADVRTVGRGSPLRATSGRQNETDGIPPGSLEFVIDNASGAYTPGRSAASCELTLNMPIYVRETLGYRTFNIFSGLLQVPDSVEQLEGIDNLITVTAVDAKQLLDNGRTMISTLAEYIMAATPTTLRHYYPLNEPEAPFRDVVGSGAEFKPALTWSSVLDTTTARPTYTPGGGVQAPGDDVRGVSFAPTTSTAGGLGVSQLVLGNILTAAFTVDQAVAFAAGESLTFVMWASVTDEWDYQYLFSADFNDLAFASSSSVILQRYLRHASIGADAGLLDGFAHANIGTGLAGHAKSSGIFTGTATGVLPFALQLSFTPNAITVWAGDQEYTATAPTGTLTSPQYVYGNIQIGAITGSASHFQIHVGAYTRADFLAQYRAGTEGLAGQRTDERIATILGYAAGDNPVQLDVGSTFMQQASLAGQKPGQAIDNAVQTERGRYFIGGDGVGRFHSRVRAYNL